MLVFALYSKGAVGLFPHTFMKNIQMLFVSDSRYNSYVIYFRLGKVPAGVIQNITQPYAGTEEATFLLKIHIYSPPASPHKEFGSRCKNVSGSI